jgi:hypothetical protein
MFPFIIEKENPFFKRFLSSTFPEHFAVCCGDEENTWLLAPCEALLLSGFAARSVTFFMD